jgi:hypothetical protein
MPDPISGGPTEIRSSKEIFTFVVRHLNDEEFEFAPALVLEGPTGRLYLTPGQVMPLISALVEMMNEAV